MNIFKLGTCTAASLQRGRERLRHVIGHILYRHDACAHVDERNNAANALLSLLVSTFWLELVL